MSMARRELPNRVLDPYAAEFWTFTLDRELRLQRCEDCSTFRWPPASVCDACLSERFEWVQVNGDGTLLSWVVFHRQYFPEYPPPHHAITVRLAEGPLFVSCLAEDFEGGLRDGLGMRLDWIEGHDGFGDFNLPVFRPA
jgi:uncharacterized OB-fold protein